MGWAPGLNVRFQTRGLGGSGGPAQAYVDPRSASPTAALGKEEKAKEAVEKLVEELAALRRQNGVLVEQVAAMGRQNLKLVEEMVAMRKQNGVLEEERKKEREELNRKIEDLVRTVGFLRKRDEDSSELEKDGLEQEKKKKKKVGDEELSDFTMGEKGDGTK